MIDLRNIPSNKENFDRYEVENNFQSWSYQPAQSAPADLTQPTIYPLGPLLELTNQRFGFDVNPKLQTPEP